MSKTVVMGETITRTTVVGIQGPAGPTGAPGEAGSAGADGAPGSNVVWRGAWSAAIYAELDGVQHDGSAWVANDATTAGDVPGVSGLWDLWVEKGDTGPAGQDSVVPGPAGSDGAAATVAVGTVTTGAAGTDAEVVNTGTSSAAVLDFTIPRGEQGIQGETGDAGAAGADGKTVLNGSGAPDSGLGVNGDFYIDTVANAIYGPKTAGAWGSGTSLIGPQGETGAAGADGADAVWGGITGTLGDQTDLQTALGLKANDADLGTAAESDAGDFATAAQGATADSALQPGDPVSVNAQTGTTYTLVLADAGKLVTLSNAGAITLTIPTNASVAFPIGTTIAGAQLGAGAVTIQGATGVTVNGVSAGSEATSAQYDTFAMTLIAADVWLVSGGLA